MEKEKLPLSVIIPVYNGETTIVKTLDSLLKQLENSAELIMVDDASTDNSREIIEEYFKNKRPYQLIKHPANRGLAQSYNDAIFKARGELIVTLHQDVVLLPGALEELLKPFGNKKVVAANHVVIFPREAWNKYNFWQKCFFARFIGKKLTGLNGQFDGFRKTALEKVKLFDGDKFRSAGEDGDIVFKLAKIGQIANTRAEILHLQSLNPNFSYRDILWKQKQHSEAQGALLALGRIRGLSNIFRAFFREILILALFIPFINIIAALFIFSYAFVYTWSVFFSEYKNPRIIILPFFNIYLLFVSFFFAIFGFLRKRQQF